MKLKANLAEIKSRLKKHGPAIAQFAITVGVTAIAVNYRKRLNALESTENDGEWVDIQFPRHMVETLEEGHTLHYRQARFGDDDYYSQCTSTAKNVGFNPEMDERFEEFKKTGTH